MSDETSGLAAARASLPQTPSLEWLRKQAKQRLAALRESDPAAKLANAQFALAKEYGFASWRALKAHIDSLTVDGQLFDAAKRGDAESLGRLLDQQPEKLQAKAPPYEWSLLHAAAHQGQLAAVELLLARGLDPNTRERGDNTYAMHWAAAAGHLAVVRRLADAGGDVVGRGDDHELEVIGWATCWDGCDDAAHRAVAELLVARGARHHIFSAIALGSETIVRGIAVEDPSQLHRRMSRNENHATPLHFAVRMRRPRMLELLLELGADPLAVDGSGFPAVAYAHSADVDRPLMKRIRALTVAELTSADRGQRSARGTMLDLLAALTLHDWATAERLVRDNTRLLAAQDATGGALHLAAKRGDTLAAKWLLEHGAQPNELWPHWDADVTPLHLAALGNHVEVARALLDAGADPTIEDSKHHSDAIGWADFFGNKELMELLEARRQR
jgi:ankyrin repeat protein